MTSNLSYIPKPSYIILIYYYYLLFKFVRNEMKSNFVHLNANEQKVLYLK
jgi:hypothetical protein